MKLLLLVLFYCSTCFAEEVAFVSGEWAPYASAKMPNKGYSTVLLQAICKMVNIEPNIKFMTWPEVEREVLAGRAFAGYPYALSDSRRAQFLFSDQIFSSGSYFFYYSGNKKINYSSLDQLAQLKKYTVGVLSGNYTEKELLSKGFKVYVFKNLEQGLGDLKKNKIDFLLEEPVSFFFYMEKFYPKETGNFLKLPFMYGKESSNGIMASRKYPGSMEILRRLNLGLAKLKDSGEYYQLLWKYRLSE